MNSSTTISPTGKLVNFQKNASSTYKLHNFRFENMFRVGNGQKPPAPVRRVNGLKKRVDKILLPLEAANS